MTKQESNKTGGRNLFLAGYGRQVFTTLPLGGILLLIFFFVFGYDADLLWINILVLAIWLILVFIAFRYRADGEIWRNYRWIIAPTVIILLFLFNVSWAQSAIAASSLEKSVFKSAHSSVFQLHAEYPSQILFDATEPSEIRLWVTGLSNCAYVTISGNGLLFTVKPSSDAPVEWSEQPTLKFDRTTTAITLLAQPSQLLEKDTQTVQLYLNSGGAPLETKDWKLTVESKRNSQTRNWKKNFLATGGTIVSLITAIFVGIKQLEEEKKRQKIKQVEQSMASFDADLINDLSVSLNKHLNLIADWDEWDRTLQDQFRARYFSLFDEKNKNAITFWIALADKTLTDIGNDVELCLRVCERIFDSPEEKPICASKQLQSALKWDGKALLSLVQDHPNSTAIVKRIAKNYPVEIKTTIIRELNKDYQKEIKILGRELNVPTEYPLLESLFWRYYVSKSDEEKLKEWLSLHRLSHSPFVDADTPFTFLPENDESILVDLTSTGFSFDLPPQEEAYFKFNDPWDLRTAIYSFCKTLPNTVASQSFIVLSSPSLLIDFEKESAINLVLHALGEQWISIITDEPTTFHDLNVHQQKVLARLLCWHYGSAHSVLARLSNEIDNKHALALSEDQRADQGAMNKEQKARMFLKKVSNWLDGTVSTPVHIEEIPYLVDLRPSSTYRTIFLMPSLDLGFQSKITILPEKYDVVDAIINRLVIHNYTFIHFYLTDRNWWAIDDEVLTRIINDRVRYCAAQSAQPDEQIHTLNNLFIPHDKEEAEKTLARKANGSPGRMVRLGQKLLLQHVEKYSTSDKENYEYLHIEDLEALKA